MEDNSEWIRRCTDRLQQQWPHVERADLEDTARELQSRVSWQRFGPEVAAVAWLKLGGLAA